ncbi:MAG: hypothetical protein V4447_10555 [Pseudomonadota bacterium]
MSSDKRSVTTDALETLGMIITENEKRDAIHLAVENVVAGMSLRAGEHILIKDDVAVLAMPTQGIGIVDPFIDGPVDKGQHFWLVIYPRQITSLRHVWTHPAFDEQSDPVAALPAPTEKEVSEAWIKNWAASIPLDFATVLQGASDYVEDKKAGGYGEYLCFGGLLEGEHVPDEFWPHYETVTGFPVDESHRGSFFTCSC